VQTVRDAVAEPGRAGHVSLLAGRVCLDFVNTVEPRVETVPGLRPRDYLAGYADLVEWAAHAEILSPDEARHLLTDAAKRPAEAVAVLQDALTLREACYRVFLAIAQGEVPPPADVAIVGEAYAAAMAHSRIVPTAGGYDLGWREDQGALDRPLWPVARSAVDLLTGGDPARIKGCSTGEEG
jgi:predicted RNA-binding Zn ribbon-like protein